MDASESQISIERTMRSLELLNVDRTSISVMSLLWRTLGARPRFAAKALELRSGGLIGTWLPPEYASYDCLGLIVAHTVCRECVHLMVDWAKRADALSPKLSPSPPGPACRGSTALAHAICSFLSLREAYTVRKDCAHRLKGRAKRRRVWFRRLRFLCPVTRQRGRSTTA